MASNHTSLDAAATERKARLAKLKSLKRKQPPSDSEDAVTQPSGSAPFAAPEDTVEGTPELATQYLSGRNYDPATRGPKLGFENAPNADAETLEDRAATIALATREKEERERKEDKPIDLFQLQPKKPNWDLKRDMARKMEVLNTRTDNAIARLVREKIEAQKKAGGNSIDGRAEETGRENVGMEGVELVEGMHVREREEEEDIKREREQDDEMT